MKMLCFLSSLTILFSAGVFLPAAVVSTMQTTMSVFGTRVGYFSFKGGGSFHMPEKMAKI